MWCHQTGQTFLSAKWRYLLNIWKDQYDLRKNLRAKWTFSQRNFNQTYWVVSKLEAEQTFYWYIWEPRTFSDKQPFLSKGACVFHHETFMWQETSTKFGYEFPSNVSMIFKQKRLSLHQKDCQIATSTSRSWPTKLKIVFEKIWNLNRLIRISFKTTNCSLKR